jgi:hypothetical protein
LFRLLIRNNHQFARDGKKTHVLVSVQGEKEYSTEHEMKYSISELE